ncbi:polysaccharide deacetylase family protein [Loktanella sp. M215]|uniref:polysaccharide deacetylase family protein n=1 Tax=Loktanella sp. M215 TaxID=2675431 RepID=UPI001F2E0821|nr:polysaccharide deacetylase family protein [Loktanella sp. M215]MCF7698689.1 polysaccharide deacetylase family protein [Loktanella sp. M215]
MSDDVLRVLDARAARHEPALLWWRDDDATVPTPALDQLLEIAAQYQVPVTLAVIPATTGDALARRLDTAPLAHVAVHGWSHTNHAPATEKKQELGAQRPQDTVMAELAAGLAKLSDLHGARMVPVLVPPWNRIAPEVLPGLGPLGFRAVSVFGPAAETAPVPQINTHVDLIDWRGTRGGRSEADLMAELAMALALPGDAPIGILSHHLVHDAAAWSYLVTLFGLTRDHPGCRWVGLPDLLPA